jgi:hypothetical protein
MPAIAALLEMERGSATPNTRDAHDLFRKRLF